VRPWRGSERCGLKYNMMRWTLPIGITLALFLSLGSGFAERFVSREQEGEPSEGARLFASACTICHDVGGITENPGIYTEQAFRDLVSAMVDYGAPLDEGEAEVLVQYLTATYGKKSP
jgi:mono/diheme cytochrome c family protein